VELEPNAVVDPTLDDMIEMGGLRAELIKDCHVSSLSPATSLRRLDKLSGQSNPRMALTSPRPLSRQASQPAGKWEKMPGKLPPLDGKSDESIGPTLKKILQIMWEPREIFCERVDKDSRPFWLTVDCDESSQRVRQLEKSERFYVLDVREAQNANGLIIRVRTRHGWFTWGRMKEINSQTDNGGVQIGRASCRERVY
jgi:hypothetical protein